MHLRKSSTYDDAVARLLANDIIRFESSNAVFNICGIEMSGRVVSRVPSGKVEDLADEHQHIHARCNVVRNTTSGNLISPGSRQAGHR